MIRALVLTAAVAAAVFAHRVGYWDGWHKGVAHGRQQAWADFQRQLGELVAPQPEPVPA